MQGAIAEMAEVPKTQEQLSAGRMDAHERPPYRDVVTPRVTRDKYGEIAAIRDFSASAY